MVEGIGWEVWCSHLSISLHPSILPAGALVGGWGRQSCVEWVCWVVVLGGWNGCYRY